MSITITLDEVTPMLANLRSAAQARGIAAVAGQAVANSVRAHLIALNSARHRYGRNYYAQAAKGVSVVPTEDNVTIGITQVGIRQRYYGGTITPKAGRKYLTIPAAPEAYGMRASEFNDLDFAFVDRNGRLAPALVRRASTAISITRRKNKAGNLSFSVRPKELREGKVMFWLVRKVTQRGDSSVLPTSAEMIAAAISAAARRFFRIQNRAAGAEPADTN